MSGEPVRFPHTTIFRTLASTWGVHIEIGGVVATEPPHDGALCLFADGVRLELGISLHADHVEPLVFGLRRAAEPVRKRLQRTEERRYVTFVIDKLVYPATDFQREGLEPAAMQWAMEAVGLEPFAVEVSFDRDRGRYSFAFDDARDRINRLGECDSSIDGVRFVAVEAVGRTWLCVMVDGEPTGFWSLDGAASVESAVGAIESSLADAVGAGTARWKGLLVHPDGWQRHVGWPDELALIRRTGALGKALGAK